MEFMSNERNSNAILSWEGDWINIDQAESVDELSESVINLGPCLRGAIRGRSRMGRLSFTANAGDNPELWHLFDLAAESPETNHSFQVKTSSNLNLTTKQVEDIKRRLGAKAKHTQWLDAERPFGDGKEFTADLMACAKDEAIKSA